MTYIEKIAEQSGLKVEVIDGLQFIEINGLIVIEAGSKLGLQYDEQVVFVDPTPRVIFRIAQSLRNGVEEIDALLNDPQPTLTGFFKESEGEEF
ncbi:hypothetical protein [Aeromonas hydrophila]